MQKSWNNEKKHTSQATKTVNKTEMPRNQSIIKPEQIANTEWQMNWFNMVSSNINTEMHTTGRDKQKVQKAKKKNSHRDTYKVSEKTARAPRAGPMTKI